MAGSIIIREALMKNVFGNNMPEFASNGEKEVMYRRAACVLLAGGMSAEDVFSPYAGKTEKKRIRNRVLDPAGRADIVLKAMTSLEEDLMRHLEERRDGEDSEDNDSYSDEAVALLDSLLTDDLTEADLAANEMLMAKKREMLSRLGDMLADYRDRLEKKKKKIKEQKVAAAIQKMILQEKAREEAAGLYYGREDFGRRVRLGMKSAAAKKVLEEPDLAMALNARIINGHEWMELSLDSECPEDLFAGDEYSEEAEKMMRDCYDKYLSETDSEEKLDDYHNGAELLLAGIDSEKPTEESLKEFRSVKVWREKLESMFAVTEEFDGKNPMSTGGDPYFCDFLKSVENLKQFSCEVSNHMNEKFLRKTQSLLAKSIQKAEECYVQMVQRKMIDPSDINSMARLNGTLLYLDQARLMKGWLSNHSEAYLDMVNSVNGDSDFDDRELSEYQDNLLHSCDNMDAAQELMLDFNSEDGCLGRYRKQLTRLEKSGKKFGNNSGAAHNVETALKAMIDSTVTFEQQHGRKFVDWDFEDKLRDLVAETNDYIDSQKITGDSKIDRVRKLIVLDIRETARKELYAFNVVKNISATYRINHDVSDWAIEMELPDSLKNKVSSQPETEAVKTLKDYLNTKCIRVLSDRIGTGTDAFSSDYGRYMYFRMIGSMNLSASELVHKLSRNEIEKNVRVITQGAEFKKEFERRKSGFGLTASEFMSAVLTQISMHKENGPENEPEKLYKEKPEKESENIKKI